MLDLNELRRIFAEKMLEQPNRRFSIDTALFEICLMAYQQGLNDAKESSCSEARPNRT